MATAPTDDPLGNSDRTVGVLGYLEGALKSLKRQALLFDQIGIPDDLNVVSDFAELDWLRDIGIVRDMYPLILSHYGTKQYLDAFVAVTGEVIDVMAIPDQQAQL
jgi:hypothetical protein